MDDLNESMMRDRGYQTYTLVAAADVRVNASPTRCVKCGSVGDAAFLLTLRDESGTMHAAGFCRECTGCVACIVGQAGDAHRETGMATFWCNIDWDGPADRPLTDQDGQAAIMELQRMMAALMDSDRDDNPIDEDYDEYPELDDPERYAD